MAISTPPLRGPWATAWSVVASPWTAWAIGLALAAAAASAAAAPDGNGSCSTLMSARLSGTATNNPSVLMDSTHSPNRHSKGHTQSCDLPHDKPAKSSRHKGG